METHIFVLQDESRIPELVELFALGLGKTAPDYWKWKHFSDNGNAKDIVIVAENLAGKIVGMYALQPRYYQNGQKRYLVFNRCDLVIHPDYRGHGLMRKMFECICTIGQSFGAAAFINFPNQESYPIALKYGAIDQKSIYTLSSKKHFFPLRTHATPIKIDDWTIKFADHMMEEMKFSNALSLKLVKNEDFLRWKFDDNPIQRFNWVHIYHKDALCGYIVYHRNKGRLRTAVNIYDWEFSQEIPITVLKKIVSLLLEEGNSVSLWGEYPEATIQMWMDAGLHYQSHEGTRFQIFPFNDEIMQESWQLTRADLDF